MFALWYLKSCCIDFTMCFNTPLIPILFLCCNLVMKRAINITLFQSPYVFRSISFPGYTKMIYTEKRLKSALYITLSTINKTPNKLSSAPGSGGW